MTTALTSQNGSFCFHVVKISSFSSIAGIDIFEIFDAIGTHVEDKEDTVLFLIKSELLNID